MLDSFLRVADCESRLLLLILRSAAPHGRSYS